MLKGFGFATWIVEIWPYYYKSTSLIDFQETNEK
jgi:hypothetical protein